MALITMKKRLNCNTTTYFTKYISEYTDISYNDIKTIKFVDLVNNFKNDTRVNNNYIFKQFIEYNEIISPFICELGQYHRKIRFNEPYDIPENELFPLEKYWRNHFNDKPNVFVYDSFSKRKENITLVDSYTDNMYHMNLMDFTVRHELLLYNLGELHCYAIINWINYTNYFEDGDGGLFYSDNPKIKRVFVFNNIRNQINNKELLNREIKYKKNRKLVMQHLQNKFRHAEMLKTMNEEYLECFMHPDNLTRMIDCKIITPKW